MSDYTPTAQWATNRPVLDDGVAPDAATWRQSLEDIYDRLEYHHDLNHVENGLVKWLRPVGVRDDNGTSGAQVFIENTSPPIIQVAALSYASYISFDVDELPDGCLLQSLRIYLKGGPSHSALPASMPQLTLRRDEPAAFTSTTLGTATDASGSTGAYEAGHSFAMAFSGSGLLIDKSAYQHRLMLRSEFGANSQPLLEIWGVKATFNMTHFDQKAG